MCPTDQATATEELACEPSYPDHIDPTNMSWTGVVCTPAGTVLCLSLPDLSFTGNIGVLEQLGPMNDIRIIDLTSNSLTGTAPCPCMGIVSAAFHSWRTLALLVIDTSGQVSADFCRNTACPSPS